MRYRAQQGFTLPEVLVAAFLLGMATVAVVGVAVFSSRSSLESERQNVALGVVNEKLEQVRVLSYEDVGLLDASVELDEPLGVVTRTETVSSNQETYDIVVTITNIDDPINGTVPDGKVDEDDADYKKVEVTAVWAGSSGTQRQVSVVTYVAPSGALRECTPGEQACPGYAGEGACVPFEVCPLSGVCPAPTEQNYFCPVEAVYCRAQTGLCTNNSQCGLGEVCNLTTGSCSLACNGSESCSCPESYQCNTTTGVCDPPPPSPSPTSSPSSSAIPSSVPSGEPSGSPSGLPSDPPPSDPPPSDSIPPSPTSSILPSSSVTPTASISHCPVDDPRVFSPGCENIAPIDPGCGCGERNITTFVQQTVEISDPLCSVTTTEQCVPVSASQSCAQTCPDSSLLPSSSALATVSPPDGSSTLPSPSASGGPSTNPSSSPGDGGSPNPSSGPSGSPQVSSSPGDGGSPQPSGGAGGSPTPSGAGGDAGGSPTPSGAGGDAGGSPTPSGSGGDQGGSPTPSGDGQPDCSDGVDNDGDGFIDDQDSGCYLGHAGSDVTAYDPADIFEYIAGNNGLDLSYQCADNADNDGDGFIDGSDEWCTYTSNGDSTDFDYLEDREDRVQLCDNALDEDFDGYTDIADAFCHTDFNPYYLVHTYFNGHSSETNTAGDCHDGINNDVGSGSVATDRRDPGCHTDFDETNDSSFDARLFEATLSPSATPIGSTNSPSVAPPSATPGES